jgi:hypothetical protein
VIWSYFEGNDLYDMMIERQTVMQRYLDDGYTQGLLGKQAEIDRALMAHIERAMQARGFRAKMAAFSDMFVHPEQHSLEWARTVKLSYVVDLLESVLDYTRKKTETSLPVPYQPPLPKDQLELFRTTLNKAQQVVNGWGGDLVFVYLPRYERYVPAIGGQPNRDDVLAIVRSLGISLVDLHPVFAAQKDPLGLFPFKLPTHYNSAGNHVVAEEILRGLHQMDLGSDGARF